MKNLSLVLFVLILLTSGCASNKIEKYPEVQNNYDPSKPLEIKSIIPSEGELNEQVIIEGNFGADASKIKVFFADTREASIISTNGTSIYCLAPKQPDGENSVKVVVDGKEITTDKTFKYNQVQKPAITSQRDTMYVVELYKNTGNIYRLTRANNWGPELIRGNIEELKDGEQWACALDKTDNYLYIRNHVGVFVRVSLKEKDANGNLKVEKLLEKSNYLNGGTMNYLAYSRVEDCFYATEDFGHAVLKIYKDESGVWKQEEYAGALNHPGNVDGDRKEALFQWLRGLTVDSEGNIYVANIGNQSIRKIAYPSGYVSTIAGGQKSGDVEVDGIPLEASFCDLTDLAVDSEDNLYIAGGAGYNVRKLAIE